MPQRYTDRVGSDLQQPESGAGTEADEASSRYGPLRRRGSFGHADFTLKIPHTILPEQARKRGMFFRQTAGAVSGAQGGARLAR